MPETVGSRLRYIREQSELTQKEAADGFGVTQTAISDYETGRRSPDLETLWELAVFYGRDPHSLDPRLASTECCGEGKSFRKKRKKK